MANLVSPGFSEASLINAQLAATTERIIEFRGINRKDFVDEGEMSDMKNLTSDNYPLLSPRKPRGTYTLPEHVTVPYKIMARYGKIAMIALDENDNVNFYFDGTKVSEINDLTSASEMVAINTKICFFPQKTCISIVQSGGVASIVSGSYTSLEKTVTLTALSPATVTISNSDARMSLSSVSGFAYDDALNINGTLTYTANGSSHTKECNVSCIIESIISNKLVLPRETFIELTGEGATNITFYGTVSRTMPNMDIIIEWNNRLWGASSADNVIYASKLGDPTNWHYFQGTGLDSYYAQQGTDGVWAGCATFSSHIIFFKQNGMARIYGSSPSNFQITNTKCYGVEEGSKASVVTVNDTVFYKSVIGIMAYDGGTPYCISERFAKPFGQVISGSEGRKYYASILTKHVGPEIMVLDIDKGVWHKEDTTRFKATCSIDDKMYFVTHNSDALLCGTDVKADYYLICGEGAPSSGQIKVINPAYATESVKDMEWSATFGPFDEHVEGRKIYSKILMRLIRKDRSNVKVYISLDGGDWEQVYAFDPASTGGDYIPIVPRRCDRYSIKIEGKGECSVKSLTRKVRYGTGGRL